MNLNNGKNDPPDYNKDLKQYPLQHTFRPYDFSKNNLNSNNPSNFNTPSLIRSSSLNPDYLRRNMSYATTPVKLIFDKDINSVLSDWSSEEVKAERRLVRFDFANISPTDFKVDFYPIKFRDYTPDVPIISCIYWREKDIHVVTSVDIILILEYLVQESFTIEEKNRIRRNLQSLKPLTVSRSNADSQRFFNLLMSMEDPRPRNIEKDLKVFNWSDLFIAVNKVTSKYTSNIEGSLPLHGSNLMGGPYPNTGGTGVSPEDHQPRLTATSPVIDSYSPRQSTKPAHAASASPSIYQDHYRRNSSDDAPSDNSYPAKFTIPYPRDDSYINRHSKHHQHHHQHGPNHPIHNGHHHQHHHHHTPNYPIHTARGQRHQLEVTNPNSIQPPTKHHQSHPPPSDQNSTTTTTITTTTTPFLPYERLKVMKRKMNQPTSSTPHQSGPTSSEAMPIKMRPESTANDSTVSERSNSSIANGDNEMSRPPPVPSHFHDQSTSSGTITLPNSSESNVSNENSDDSPLEDSPKENGIRKPSPKKALAWASNGNFASIYEDIDGEADVEPEVDGESDETPSSLGDNIPSLKNPNDALAKASASKDDSSPSVADSNDSPQKDDNIPVGSADGDSDGAFQSRGSNSGSAGDASNGSGSGSRSGVGNGSGSGSGTGTSSGITTHNTGVSSNIFSNGNTSSTQPSLNNSGSNSVGTYIKDLPKKINSHPNSFLPEKEELGGVNIEKSRPGIKISKSSKDSKSKDKKKNKNKTSNDNSINRFTRDQSNRIFGPMKQNAEFHPNQYYQYPTQSQLHYPHLITTDPNNVQQEQSNGGNKNKNEANLLNAMSTVPLSTANVRLHNRESQQKYENEGSPEENANASRQQTHPPAPNGDQKATLPSLKDNLNNISMMDNQNHQQSFATNQDKSIQLPPIIPSYKPTLPLPSPEQIIGYSKNNDFKLFQPNPINDKTFKNS